MFDAIPLELRLYDNWILWRKETASNGRVIKVPYSVVTGRRADIREYRDHGSFDAVVSAHSSGMFDGIGFVLTKDDPFVFIDLDEPKENQEFIWAEQQAIYNNVVSYAEKSPSGNGLHIICKGQLPRARKTKIAELYDCDRFMTMTGNVFRNEPINDLTPVVNALFEYLGGQEAEINEFYAGESEQTLDDYEIILRASNASNGEKFSALYRGDWQNLYPSQSEADQALINIIAFYTQNGEQIKRIFHTSALANRDKAFKEQYLGYNIKKALDRQLPPVNLSALKQEFENTKKEPVKKAKKTQSGYTLPGGLIGEMAQYFYASSPRPVEEIALVAAIGLMAGISGRAYNVSNTGLNMYLLLLAPTGTGKEGIASGVSKLMREVSRNLPIAGSFLGPDKISSEQAIARYMSKDGNTSFVSIIGEFGIQFAQMASENAPSHLMGVKRALLDMYTKSGQGNVMRGSIYSDSEKNINEIISPALSLVGESVPQRFYNAIDESVISDGLLPRFSVFEYLGKRPSLNEGFDKVKPSQSLVEKVKTLVANAKTLNQQNKAITVEFTEEAYAIFKKFNQKCDDNINASDVDVTRQLWNRAHLKALKLAALVAVGINPFSPTICKDCANWGIDLVERDVLAMLDRFASGDVGSHNEEINQIRAICGFCHEYLTTPYQSFLAYSKCVSFEMHKDKVISWSLIQRKLHKLAVFRDDKYGGTAALKRTVQTLIERGDLVRLPIQDAVTKYNCRAECYVIANSNIQNAE